MTAAAAYAGVQLLAGERPTPEHEQKVHEKLGIILCDLLEIRPPRLIEVGDTQAQHPYYLPARTLTGIVAEQLGIRSEQNFFGGWVSDPFIATKAISHPLFPGSGAPSSWHAGFADLAGDALLPGWTVFSKADARRAGLAMLERAPLRLKPVRATAGRGQQVITQLPALDAALDAMDDTELAQWGLVLEENLADVETFSVGQVRVGSHIASYHGTQRLTQDNAGEWVYGGSNLVVYRGDYSAILEQELAPAVRTAIEQARSYEAAVERSYPGFFASRRNYDIAIGTTHEGKRLSGVLEQSWRVGGASSAELLALQAFKNDPTLRRVNASTHEVFGAATVPPGAELFFEGDDAEVGPITKYARIQTHGHSE
ncbi:DUF3182 family protein [Pseudomonas sp. RIT-PI-S]|uniref:DUF3182 family protein n=1 Tax=Pseudomonas sp. RIT-PI-S TaxID=3035295 RepID=UPI0021D7DCD0|nr:DUF3182 family protein [Pseudomonas sp. RIT-PI-S]